MPGIVVVKDGQDPLSKPIMDYLAKRYGIPAGDVIRVTLESRAGDVQTVTVQLLVRPGNGDPWADEDGCE